MKILHTADIHLKEHKDERWEALQRLIGVGREEKIEVLVISGDLFDQGINAENLRPKIREVFSNTGFKIVLIPGNHDRDSYTAGRYFGEDAVILTNIGSPFEYKDVRVWGIPFEPLEGEKILNKLHSLANSLTQDKKNILLYHGELLDAFFSRGDFGDEGEERYMPVKLSYFKGLNIDYVLSGHFHSHFDVWEIEDGRYFVYPGSPISITKRETGQRKVNIFEVGDPPQEYPLDTPHFEEVVIEFDPFKDKEPLKIVKEHLSNLHPQAKVILKVKGFINSKVIGMNETELVEQIKKTSAPRSAGDEDLSCEFRDIQIILEDDLFKIFIEKLKQSDYEEEKKRQMQDLVIKAMMGVRQ